MRAIKWPNLAKMVKQYFPVPASSAGVERVFSAAGKMHGDLQKFGQGRRIPPASTRTDELEGVFALPACCDPLMGVTLAVNRLRECSNSMNQLRIVCTNRFLGEVPVNDHD